LCHLFIFLITANYDPTIIFLYTLLVFSSKFHQLIPNKDIKNIQIEKGAKSATAQPKAKCEEQLHNRQEQVLCPDQRKCELL